MDLINYFLQDDKILFLDNNLYRYRPICLSSSYDKFYYDNIMDLIVDVEKLPRDFRFPKALRKITFKTKFNQEVDLSNLNKITHLIWKCNKKVNLSNLSNLTNLTFGWYFNQEVDLSNLVNLNELYIGYHFDKDIDLSGMNNLKHFYYYSNKEITNVPESLEEITLLKKYDKERIRDKNLRKILKLN